MFPGKIRKHVYSVYSFARYADDIADTNKLSSSGKIKKLEDIGNGLLNSLEGRYPDTNPEMSIMIALTDTIRKYDVPYDEFLKLLQAFRQDAWKTYYKTYEELIEYSEYSANPVGRIILRLFGYKRDDNENIFKLSDKICTALQLINFWQDVSRDLKINRVYIPEELMREYQYDLSSLYKGITNDEFRNMIRELVSRSEVMLDEGKKISGYLKGRLKAEIKAICSGGALVIKKIKNINYNVLHNRPYLTNYDQIKILFGKGS